MELCQFILIVDCHFEVPKKKETVISQAHRCVWDTHHHGFARSRGLMISLEIMVDLLPNRSTVRPILAFCTLSRRRGLKARLNCK